MSLHCLFSMPSAMNYVAPRGVSVVCRLFVMAGVVVLGSLLVMASGMLKMFCYLPVVFSCFLRHRFSPREFRTLRLFRLRDTPGDPPNGSMYNTPHSPVRPVTPAFSIMS